MASVKKKKKSNFADQVINGDYQSVFSGGNTGIGSNKSVGITSNKRSLLGDDSPFLSTKKKSSFADQVIGGTFEPFVDTTPKITNNKDYSSLNKNELKKEKEKLQKEIEKQSKKLNKTPLWDKEDNVVENIGNVLYKSFLEKEPIVHDEEYKKYKALTEQMNELKKAQEDNYVKNQKYDKGLLGFIEKSNDTTVGNVMTGIKGIESTTKKILGQEDDIDYDLTLEEKFSSKAREESSGAMGVYLDVIGSIARMTPQLMIGNSKGALALGFANYGGGAYNEAKRDGYSEEQATKYGLTVGAMEMATERILGGFGNLYGMSKMGKVTGKVIDKVIPKLIKNKAVREIINQSIAEGSEEFLQEYLGNVAKDVILDEKGFFKSVGENVTDTDVLADALYSAFVGGLTGGLVATKPSIDKAKYEKATGRNAETGLTVNEQSVIDSVSSEKKAELQKKKAVDTEVNKIIKEQEKTFGTLTNAEKKGIRQDIQSRLNNGEINYSTVKLSNKEIKTIESQVKDDLQKGYIGTDVIENTLGKDVDLSKDDYLQKSYYEKSLKSKQFTYKASENDSEFRKELAKTSDVLNDTTRSHELFDTVAKISEDTGTKYGFVNNEKLRSLGHNVEGKTINGLVRVNEDGTSKVLINVDSDKALNTIIGHETTHLLEGTNEYQALQDIVKEYAKNKGDYDSKYSQISSLYQGTNANVDNEVTSDLVGDYLFTDEEFVKNLSAKEPTVFQKVYDYIKHVYNLVTAGSKEQRELEKVKYRFEQAYNEMNKTTNQQSETNLTTEADNDRAKELSGTKYSLSDNQGRTLSKEQQEYFKDSKVRDEEGNLITVYHTMTNKGIQFNEFNPVGTDYYKFGDQVVNYYTDSKNMSGSYAQQDYEMADTSKLNNLSEAYDYVEKIKNTPNTIFSNDVMQTLNLEESNGKYALKFNGNTMVTYDSETDVLKKIKVDLDNRYGKQNKYQYEGYINITNPYVVDAEGRSWGKAEIKFNDNKQDDLNKITSDLNKVEQLKSLMYKSRNLNSEYDLSGDEWTYYHYKNTADALKGRELNEAVQYCAMFGFEYNDYAKMYENLPNYAKMYENLPSGDSTVTDLTTDLTDTNYNMFKNMTLSDFVRVYAQEYKKNMLYGKEDSYFNHEYKNITGELKELTASDLFNIATKRFTVDSITDTILEYSSTNNVVKKVIDMNKNGSKYDGVIFKNVVDYGGKSEGDYSPADVYVTFNSNQFKAVDNTNPTSDADIRYSLTRASMEQVEQAVKLEKQNKTPEEIYLETGAYRGAEGLWRTEIDDSKATIKISSTMVGGKYKLKDILEFPNLYKAYPEFKEMTVIFDDNMLPNELGKYNTETDMLTINSSLYDYKQAELLSAKKKLADLDNTVKTYEVLFPREQIEQHLEDLKDKAKKYKRKDYQKKLKSTLLHELQHVIQEKEGFSSGASPSYWRKKQLITEGYRNAYVKRENELYEKMNMDKFFNDMWGKVQDMTWEEFKQAREDFIDSSEYGQQYRDLQELMEKTKKRYEILTGRSAYELYRDTAGEEEAREVQKRMDLSSKDRKRFIPYVSGSETVFYEGVENEKKYGVMFNKTDDIRYSFSKADNKGRELTPQQQEYFKDSKARDEKGNLLTLYHGTYNDEMFTVFDAKKGFNVDAIYLTPDLSVSSYFGNGSTIRNFDKTLIPRINEAKTVDDLIKIFNDDLNNKIEITKSYSDENGDFYRLETMDGVSSKALGYKTGKNTYSFTNFNGEVKETNLFDKLKKEALEKAQQNQSYASNYELYANIVNPLVVDAKGKPYYKIDFEGKITNTETISVIAKERGYDGVIVKNVLETSYENQLTDDYIVFNSNQIKDVKNTTPTENKDIRYSLSKTEETKEYNYQSLRPKVRGGWTIEKIQKQLKQEQSSRATGKDFAEFTDINELMDNIYYHGSISYHENLKTGSTLPEEARTGGYGQEYHTISLSKSKNIASNFSSMGSNGVVTPVLLKKGAKVIEMPDIEDSIELEDMLPELWEQKVDAVKIGDWDIEKVGYGEQEIVILNPRAIATIGKGATYYRTYKKPKFENLNEQEIIDLYEKYNQSSIDDLEYRMEQLRNREGTYARYEGRDAEAQTQMEVYQKRLEGVRQRIGKFDTQLSLSREGQDIAPVGNYNVYGKDVRLQQQVQEAIAPLQEQVKVLSDQLTTLTENIAPVSQDIVERENMNNFNTLTDEDAPTNLSDEETRELNRLNSLPFDLEGEEQSRVDELTSKQDEYGSFTLDNETPEVKSKSAIIKDLKSFGMSQQEARNLYNKIANDSTTTPKDIFNELKNYRDIYEESDYYKQIRDDIKGTRLNISNIKDQIKDYGNSYRMSLMGKRLILGNSGQPIDTFYQELSNNYPDVFSPEITAEADQLDAIVDFLYRDDKMLVDRLSDGEITELANKIYNEIDTTERLNNTRETLYSNSNFKNLVSLLEAGEITPETYEDFLKNLPKELSTKYEPYLEFARELNALSTDKTRQKDRIRSLLDEKSIKVQETTNEPTISSNNPFNELLDKFLKRKKTKSDVAPKVEKSKVRNLVDTTKELFVNRNTEIDNLAKESGNLNIKYAGDMLNSVAGEVEGDIYTAQTDNYGHEIGKSVSGLFQEAKNKGLYDAFNDYLEQYSNIDRHSRGKGSQTPLAVSQTLVQEYEKSYPEFKKMAQDVWKYSSNIRDNMVESGLITQEFSDTLAEMYPHYVPFMENREMTNVYQDIGKVKPKGVIKYAKGGAKNLLPVEEALTKYTYASKKAIRQNQLYQQIVNTLNDKVEIGADVRSDPTELNESLYRDEKGNYLTAYVNGKQESVRISDDLYRGLKNDMESRIKDLEQRLSLITKPIQKISKARRNLLTTWSPTFIITNPVKDIQDAVFNSKYTKDMLKNYPTSFMELSKAKSETAKQFLALYGSGNTQGDYSTDSGLNKGIAKKNTKFLKGISKLNNIVELAPRYAEFKASLENGATVQEAMYNAREITTNFNRGGTITKALNRNGATFLNASVQGFDKFIRNFSGENGAKGVASALLKAGLFGILPGVFNELVFGGDDDDKDKDYEALPDYIKDNYYLVKMENGEFIRIPKGRMLSVFGSSARRTIEYLNGEDDAFEGFLKNAYTQVGFDDPAESNIFTPIKQAVDNKAWYGGDLVPSRLQKLAPKEQYDASTDKFSIWLGDKLNISPYKINYVLDQYTGGLGDMVLPLITEEAQSDSDSIPEMMLAPIRDKFTANSISDNKYASDIYTLSDKIDKATSDIKETDEYKIQDSYLYEITSQMAELYQERRDVQADTSLSKSEKYKKVQAIQEQINSLAKEGLDNYKNVQKTDNYAIVGGREFNKYTTDDGKERWGKPREDELNDLNSMGMTLYEKSSYFKAKTDISSIKDEYKDSEDYVGQKRDIIDVIKNTYLNDEQKSYLYDRYYGNTETLGIVNAIGIDFDSFLDYEAQQFTSDKDENGKTISGSKKRKVFDYINSMDIDFEQKLILAKLQYKDYDEYNYDIVDYLNNNDDISYEDEITILKKLGFTVDDEGNIYW